MKAYEFRTETATSGEAFFAYGNTAQEMIAHACLALEAAMYDLSRVEGKLGKELAIDESNLEEALCKILQKVVEFKDVEKLVFSSFKVMDYKVINASVLVRIQMQGEEIDCMRHKASANVKEVRMEELNIEQLNGIWRAAVALEMEG